MNCNTQSRIDRLSDIFVTIGSAMLLGLNFGCGHEELGDVTVAAATQTNQVAQASANKSKAGQEAVTAATPPAVSDRKTFDDKVRPFFEAHCVRCHGSEKAEAKLRLDTLAADFVTRPAADNWVEILDRINLGEMPPEDEPRPKAESLAIVVDWITSEMRQVRVHAQSTRGRALLRRLTRLEYANTVRDLLNVEFAEGTGPLEQLPPDGAMGGFDRVSKALLLDPSLMEAYLTVAQSVVERAVVFRPPLVPQRTLRFEFEQTPHTPMSYIPLRRSSDVEGDFLVMMEASARTFGKLKHPFNDKEIPITGRYKVRVRAAAQPGSEGPVYMDIRYGAEGRQAQFRVDATKDKPKIYEFEKTFDAFTPGEFNVGIVNGTRFNQGNAEWYQLNNKLTKLAVDGKSLQATRMKARMRAEGAYDHYVRGSYLPNVLHIDKLPKLYLDWIELVGPLQGEFPPPSMATLFGDEDTASQFIDGTTDRKELLRQTTSIFNRLLPRAFRRPVEPDEVQALVGLVDAELQADTSPQEALETGLVAMLCSPDFLLLFEPAQQAEQPRRLTDHELACRLSYFLWSTMPDQTLTQLADEGRLKDPDELKKQVDRMLSDSRAEGFVDGFARQWLKIDEIDRFPPDQQIYPDYYATDMVGIEADVKEEPLAFFREVLRRDEPVAAFLDSDWLMLNERLARLYRVPGVDGAELRRVPLTHSEAKSDSHRRGGLLGMAGVHLWGADGSRTKPVERGKYILTVLFNDPPPPPPPNAGEVEPNLRGEKLTVRERLARHREQTTCNNCHRRIDPYGMAMENFNVIGKWRKQLDGEKPLSQWGDNRPVIDPSGKLPNGRSYADFIEFKQELVKQEERFVRALAEKLFVYALGRTVEPSDRQAIDRVVAAMQKEDSSLRTMLKEIVVTEQFLVK